MRLLRFIGHPNGIVFRVFKQVSANKRRKYRIVPSSAESLDADKREMSALLVIKKLSGTKSLGTVSSNPQFDISAVSVTRKSSGTQLVTKKLVTLSKEMKMKTKTETEMETDQRLPKALVEFLNKSILDTEMKKENQRLACSAKQCLPSFISHPNGIVLCVFKRKRKERELCCRQ